MISELRQRIVNQKQINSFGEIDVPVADLEKLVNAVDAAFFYWKTKFDSREKINETVNINSTFGRMGVALGALMEVKKNDHSIR